MGRTVDFLNELLRKKSEKDSNEEEIKVSREYCFRFLSKNQLVGMYKDQKTTLSGMFEYSLFQDNVPKHVFGQKIEKINGTKHYTIGQFSQPQETSLQETKIHNKSYLGFTQKGKKNEFGVLNLKDSWGESTQIMSSFVDGNIGEYCLKTSRNSWTLSRWNESRNVSEGIQSKSTWVGIGNLKKCTFLFVLKCRTYSNFQQISRKQTKNDFARFRSQKTQKLHIFRKLPQWKLRRQGRAAFHNRIKAPIEPRKRNPPSRRIQRLSEQLLPRNWRHLRRFPDHSDLLLCQRKTGRSARDLLQFQILQTTQTKSDFFYSNYFSRTSRVYEERV